MADLQSCGFLVYRTEPNLSFLLMQHPTRWDLPKGHVDTGETEIECAIRELHEETGIRRSKIRIDEQFRFDHGYTVAVPKYGYQPKRKTLTIFLAELIDSSVEIQVSEHDGYQWFDWNPPHNIQARTIDPVLKAIETWWEGSEA